MQAHQILHIVGESLCFSGEGEGLRQDEEIRFIYLCLLRLFKADWIEVF